MKLHKMLDEARGSMKKYPVVSKFLRGGDDEEEDARPSREAQELFGIKNEPVSRDKYDKARELIGSNPKFKKLVDAVEKLHKFLAPRKGQIKGSQVKTLGRLNFMIDEIISKIIEGNEKEALEAINLYADKATAEAERALRKSRNESVIEGFVQAINENK